MTRSNFNPTLTYWKMGKWEIFKFQRLRCCNEEMNYKKSDKRDLKWRLERSNLHAFYIPLYRSCDVFFKFIFPNFIQFISSSFYLNILEFESFSSKHTLTILKSTSRSFIIFIYRHKYLFYLNASALISSFATQCKGQFRRKATKIWS